MPYPGSTDTLTLTVAPYDNTTQVTLTLKAPDGTSTPVTPVSADAGHTWTANPVYTATGEWVAHWEVTGTGAGVTEQTVWVSQPAVPSAGVAWRPERWNVAAYIPRRTLVAAQDGYGNVLYTFDDTTHPRGPAVDLLITDACAWVTLATGPVDSSLYGPASACAAIYAAAAVDRGYPDNRDDLSNADALTQQAAAMRADLKAANEAITGEDPEDPTAHLMPVYSFPDPPGWGDEDFL